MIRMYDFGSNTRNVSVNERKAFAWPVAVWTCYIPESEIQQLNILEHLILELVNKGYADITKVLCNDVGFSKELVEAAIAKCTNLEYFDQRYKTLTLSKEGKKLLNKFSNPYRSDLEVSKKNKKIYMIQDMVTKSIVPVFDITKLPDFYVEDENALKIKLEDYSNKKPRSAAIKTAIRYWGRLCINRRKGFMSNNNTIDMTEQQLEKAPLDDFIPFEDEVEWESIYDDGSSNEDSAVQTLADKEQEEQKEIKQKEVEKITILDDTPEKYFARGYIAINRNSPDEIIVISPFGDRMDDWFRTVINRMRTCNSDFEDEIQLFLMLKKEELKEDVAFGNDLNIDLFNEFPFICNDQEFKAVKKTISRLTVCKNRFENGEDESINFAQSLRTAYEAGLRLMVKKNDYLFKCKELEYDQYKENLRMLVKSYPFLEDNVYSEYSSFNMYKNMISTSSEDGYATAFFALILMDAWNDKSGKSMDLLRNIPRLPIRLKELTSNLKKKKGDGTAASHGGDAIADIKFTEKIVIQQYEEFQNVLRAIYNRFMEEK